MKTCLNCKLELSLENFHKHKNRKFGVTDFCKTCRNPLMVAKRFKISLEYYKNLKTKCQNSCQICNTKCKKLAIDHCHKTNKIRGMLCTNCNNGLGRFKDNIKLLENAIIYLKENLDANN